MTRRRTNEGSVTSCPKALRACSVETSKYLIFCLRIHVNPAENTATRQVTMSCDAVLLMVFLTVAFRQIFADQCIFSTASFVKAPPSVVTESTVISNFEHDCEFHCYTNPSRCIAANVVPLPNGTYQCEFVSVKVTPDYRAVLEPNPGGKYIYVAAGMSEWFTDIIEM